MTLEQPIAPYLYWAKSRQPAAIDLAGSNLVHCSIDELPGAREAVDLTAPNDNGYAPLVDSIARHYGVPSTHVVTAMGCSGANFISVAALAGAGDHVLIEHPTYDPLLGACRLMGATIERFSRRFEDGWQIDVDDLTRRLTSKTKLVIITSPHNPSGQRVDRSSLEAIGRAAECVGATVFVDEVYLDGANAIGNAQDRALPAARLDGPFLSTSSLTKSYGLAGLRSGWMVCRPELAERLRRTRDVVDNASPGPSDRLAAFAFTHLPALTERARKILSKNVERARALLAAHSQLEVAAPPACSVMFPRLRGVNDSEPFVKRLLEEHGVAVAPGHFFEAPAHFRLSLAGRSEALEEGLARLSRKLEVRS